ncbi:MAG: type VII secretion integral membrane protein EccD [Pseudonocardia sp.]
MSRLEAARFCRVTVLAPRNRIDLALPTDLTVAELVPMLCELAGESRPRGRAGRPAPGSGGPGHGGIAPPSIWCLAAVAGAELPAGSTLAGLGVLDGDLLRLRPRAEAPPPPVFDDPVDAVAEVVPAADGSPGPWGHQSATARPEPLALRPWTRRCRRGAGLAIGGVALASAAVLLAATRELGPLAAPVAAVIGGLAAVAALVGTSHTVRLDPAAAALLAGGSLPLAAASGFAALPGAPGAGHLLLAAALAAAAGAASLTVLGAPAPPLVAVTLTATACAAAALLATLGVGSVGALAAGAAAIALGALPVLPKISVRLAGLPPPVVPTTAEEMATADAQWQLDSADDIRHHARLAHAYLGGLVSGASAVAAAGAALAAATGGLAGAVFASVVVAVLLLRSRAYATALASGAPLVAGVAAGLALAAGLGALGPVALRLGAGLGLLVAGAVSLALVWDGATRAPSPVARRTVDILEAVLVVAAFPLALWVMDMFHVVRGL